MAGVFTAAGCMAAIASPAGAQSPAVNGYTPNGPSVQAKVDSPAKSDSLPFTGINVGLVAGAGLALGGAGAALRRAARARHSS